MFYLFPQNQDKGFCCFPKLKNISWEMFSREIPRFCCFLFLYNSKETWGRWLINGNSDEQPNNPTELSIFIVNLKGHMFQRLQCFSVRFNAVFPHIICPFSFQHPLAFPQLWRWCSLARSRISFWPLFLLLLLLLLLLSKEALDCTFLQEFWV